MRRTHYFSRQSGVTLLEVLVGFVIFISSLVAVLDHVANGIYLQKKAAQKAQRAALVRDRLALSSSLAQPVASEALVTTDNEIMERVESSRQPLVLRRIEYRFREHDGEVTKWSVLRME